MEKKIIGGIMIFILILLVLVFLNFTKETKAVPCSEEYYEAIEKLNVTLCESVTGPANEYCRDNCINEIAYAKEDPSLCELIDPIASTDEEGLIPVKDMCYIHLASKDISLCDNVESSWAKEHCAELAST